MKVHYSHDGIVRWEDYTIIPYNGHFDVSCHIENVSDYPVKPLEITAAIYDKYKNLVAKGPVKTFSLSPGKDVVYSARITSSKLNVSDEFIVVFVAAGKAGDLVISASVRDTVKGKKVERILSPYDDKVPSNNNTSDSKITFAITLLLIALLVGVYLMQR